MDISLIASSVRPHLWADFFKSLEGNDCKWEVIFAGDLTFNDIKPYKNLTYLFTERIKPAQCYELARREAQGDLIMWVADDCEFSQYMLDDIVTYYRARNQHSLHLSVKTVEDGKEFPLENHRFFERNYNTPQMAPLGVIRRDYLEYLGGFDRRFVCGQYENDVTMRVHADGGIVEKYEKHTVYIEHIKKHGKSTKFWSGYDTDRKVLEDTWCINGYEPTQPNLIMFDLKNNPPYKPYCPIINREVSRKPLLPFEPYDAKDLSTKSQSNKGQWE